MKHLSPNPLLPVWVPRRASDTGVSRALLVLHDPAAGVASPLTRRFDATAPAPNLAPSWNTPPTGDMLVATYTADGKRISGVMRWGLIPRWAKDIKVGYSTFNARADSIADKPAFRDAWKRGQRCLVVTDGFYEWRKKDRQPFAIGMADGDLMVMAGLWDAWVSSAGERLKSCTVITCEPNGVVGTLHDRMPVILEEKDWPRWLGEQPATEEELKAPLTPCADERLKMWSVHKKVGNVRSASLAAGLSSRLPRPPTEAARHFCPCCSLICVRSLSNR